MGWNNKLDIQINMNEYGIVEEYEMVKPQSGFLINKIL